MATLQEYLLMSSAAYDGRDISKHSDPTNVITPQGVADHKHALLESGSGRWQLWVDQDEVDNNYNRSGTDDALDTRNLDGSSITDPFSGMQADVYFDESAGELVIAFRGTEVTISETSNTPRQTDGQKDFSTLKEWPLESDGGLLLQQAKAAEKAVQKVLNLEQFDGLRISRNLGIDFTRSRAVVSRDRGQPFREVGQSG